MRIVYVIDYLCGLSGGTEKQLYMLIKGMISRGHHVQLFVLRDVPFTTDLSDFPCNVKTLGIDSVFSLPSIPKLLRFRRELISGGVDVVHGFFNDVALILAVLLVGTKIRTFTSRRDMGIWYTPAKLRYLRFFRFTNTRLICNGKAVAELAQEKEKKSWDAIKVIYNALEKCPFKDSMDSYEWLPKQNDSSVIANIVLVANVRPVKRLEDLIKAAARLRNAHARFKFYIMGSLQDERYYAALCELIRSNQLNEDFFFVGPVDEPRRLLSRFDIGVLTSESEGLSNTIIEYLDAGLPVVASRVGGNPELIQHGCNGLLYDMGNVDALAECLQKLAVDAYLRASIAGRAKDAVNRFAGTTMVSSHEEEYMRA